MSTVFGPNILKLPQSIWELTGQNFERAVHDEIKLGLHTKSVVNSLFTRNSNGANVLNVAASAHNFSNFELIIETFEKLKSQGSLSGEQKNELDTFCDELVGSHINSKAKFKSGDNDHLVKRIADSPLLANDQKQAMTGWINKSTAFFGHTDTSKNIPTAEAISA